MRQWLLLLLVLQMLGAGNVMAADEALKVTVADPFIELHTGPGPGYPIFYVVDRGESIEVLKRRTQWFKVRSQNAKEGWVSIKQLEKTLHEDGQPVSIPGESLADYQDANWEVGMGAGDFGGANLITAFGAYRFTRNLSVELGVSQILGDFSDGWVASLKLNHLFFPKWRVSPFFGLGTGVIHVEPKGSLVQAEDRTDMTAIWGAGLKAYASRNFVVRAEYNNYLVFSSRDDNEDENEWKLTFAVFF
ncbi:MAG: SH3 domain-containing protein [Gammaproteobacteria bacterium]